MFHPNPHELSTKLVISYCSHIYPTAQPDQWTTPHKSASKFLLPIPSKVPFPEAGSVIKVLSSEKSRIQKVITSTYYAPQASLWGHLGGQCRGRPLGNTWLVLKIDPQFTDKVLMKAGTHITLEENAALQTGLLQNFNPPGKQRVTLGERIYWLVQMLEIRTREILELLSNKSSNLKTIYFHLNIIFQNLKQNVFTPLAFLSQSPMYIMIRSANNINNNKTIWTTLKYT